MALIMALVAVIVLTVVLTTVIFLTASGARDANRTNAGQKAHAIAEAGLNNALAQVASHYPLFSPAGNSSWVSDGGGQSYNGGTVRWTGTFSGGDWSLTGTGTVPNPTGGTAIVRNVSAKLHVSWVPANFQPYGIFSGDPQAQCTQIGGNVSVNVPIYVKNCLFVNGTFANFGSFVPDAKIWDPPPYTLVGSVSTSQHTVTVNVVNALTLSGGSATIGNQVAGTIDHRVKLVAHGSCVSCGTAIKSLSETNTPDNSVSLPTLDAATVYSGTNWGSATCSTTGGATNPFDTSTPRNNVGGNLFPGSGSYSCSLTDSNGQTHSISYTTANTTCGSITKASPIGCLTVSNSWYVDSDLSVPNALTYIAGQGTLYVNGVVTLTSSASLCASSDCISWDPTSGSQPNLLIVALNASATPAATAFQMNGSAVVEANAWAIGNGTGDTSPTPPTATCSTGAFSSAGSAFIGGSVWTQNGCAKITGGGVLHAAVALPSGSPTSSQYDLVTPISGYKGG